MTGSEALSPFADEKYARKYFAQFYPEATPPDRGIISEAMIFLYSEGTLPPDAPIILVVLET